MSVTFAAVASACTGSGVARTDDGQQAVAGASATAGEARAPGGDSASTTNTGRRRRVLLLGTSLTAGYGLDPSEAYPTLLQRAADSAGFNVEFVNAGVSGETSAGARARTDWLLRAPTDVFVLETGANDGLRGTSPGQLRQNLTAILRSVKAKQPTAQLVLVQMEAPPNLGPGYTKEFRDAYIVVAREQGALLAPFLLDGVAGFPALNQGDGIHPNAAGARIVAANVWRALMPVLQQQD